MQKGRECLLFLPQVQNGPRIQANQEIVGKPDKRSEKCFKARYFRYKDNIASFLLDEKYYCT